jgi:hypothetical protein
MPGRNFVHANRTLKASIGAPLGLQQAAPMVSTYASLPSVNRASTEMATRAAPRAFSSLIPA